MTMTETTAVRRAGRPDRAALNGALAAAFLDDPVFTWLMPQRDDRRGRLPATFDAFTAAFARHDETHLVPSAGSAAGSAAGGAAGVAMWAPPGVEPVHPDDEDRFGAELVAVAGDHLERFTVCMERFGEVHPEEPAWYLQFLGVDPLHQGQGFGSRLLRDVLDRADRAGESAYLEATSPRNRVLYERHGFRCIGEIQLPDGPTVFSMWRDPAGGSTASDAEV